MTGLFSWRSSGNRDSRRFPISLPSRDHNPVDDVDNPIRGRDVVGLHHRTAQVQDSRPIAVDEDRAAVRQSGNKIIRGQLIAGQRVADDMEQQDGTQLSFCKSEFADALEGGINGGETV